MGFEPTYNGFANRCLTTWLPRQSDPLGETPRIKKSGRNLTRLVRYCKASSNLRHFEPTFFAGLKFKAQRRTYRSPF